MRFGSTAKVLAKCMLKYYRISERAAQGQMPNDVSLEYLSIAWLSGLELL